NLDVAGISVDQGIYRRDASLDCHAGEGIAGHVHRQAGMETAELLLRNGEVGIDGVECLQGDYGVPLAEHLAEVDLADPKAAAERGAERLLGDGGADVGDL